MGASYSPEGVYPLCAFRDRREKELFLGRGLKREVDRLAIEIGQQRKLELAELIKRDRLDIDARSEFYHARDGVPVGRVAGDQNVGGVQCEVALGPDR